MNAERSHILLMRLSAIGDVAITIPLILALKEQYPQLKISFLSKRFAATFIEQIPGVEFIEADVKGQHKGVKGLIKLSSLIKSKKIQLIADLHDVIRTKIIRLFFSFTSVQIASIDKGRQEKKRLVSGKEDYFTALPSSLDRYCKVLAELGLPIKMSEQHFLPKLKISDTIKNNVEWSSMTDMIGIAPFAAHKSKMYPLHLMEKLIQSLAKRESTVILLFGGGKQEVKKLTEIASSAVNVINVAGKYDLYEELSLISNLKLMISMDSGNGHMAAMYGVDVITLWGVTHPYAGFAPYAQPSEHWIMADREQYPLIPTSVYGKSYPANYENCMDSISVESIINRVEKILT